MRPYRIKSGPRSMRREVKRSRSTAQKSDHIPMLVGRCELDTRADTICAGQNFRMLSPTGQTCDVQGFHDNFDSIKDVPIGTVATVFRDEHGARHALIIHEALYFGNDMDHSLINPNQIRHFGIPVSDDPYDSTRDFGIDHAELFIPFETEGCAVYFDTSVPTDEDLETLAHVVLTDGKNEWSPSSVEMSSNRPYGDNTTITIQAVTRENYRRALSRPIEYESDLVLGSISGSFLANDAYERMVSSVRVQLPSSYPTHPSRSKQRNQKVISNTRHSVISTELLMKMHGIGIDKAKQMLAATTQKGVRTAVFPINKRYRVDHLDLHRTRLKGKWSLDWMPSGTKSITQCTGAWVYTNGHFTEVYPREDRTSTTASATLDEFCQDVGIPEQLKSDRAPELCGRTSEFLKNAKKKGIDLTYAEPERKNQIWKVDIEIRELKKRWHQKKKTKAVPSRLWDFGAKYTAKIMQFLPRNSLNGRTGYEEVTGKTPDISEYCDFDFYDLVWYYPGVHPSISEDNRALGRWLGVSHRIGSDMCYWIMPVNGQAIAETTVQHVTRDDMLDPTVSKSIEKFDEALNKRLDDANFNIAGGAGLSLQEDDYDLPKWDPAYGDRTPTQEEYGTMGNETPLADADDKIDAEVYDKYIGAKIVLDEESNNGGNIGTVKRRATDRDGFAIGRPHSNVALDTREYEIEMDDGTTERLLANKIAANIYATMDDEGREILAFGDIIDHKKDGRAVTEFRYLSNGHKKCTPTTKGWKILVEWKDETTTWMDMKDVKEANPIELAEYAVASKIDEEPAFAWWVPYTLRKRDRIIAKVKTKYWKTTHKYGVRLPKSAAEALQIDAETGTDFWEKALNKEMGKVVKMDTYKESEYTPEQIRNGNAPTMKGFQEISCHIIFDVKMDFTRKARFVANGSTTDTPVGLCYSSVVSRDSVRISFLIAALNELNMFACDIGNAYLNAPCKEKIWFEAGIECGKNANGKAMILCRALYGLKSSGASWRQMFKNFIESTLNFTPSKVDPDMYYRRNRKVDGEEYYELLLVYVDDVLAISHDPEQIMEQIAKRFEIKNDEYGPPKSYLGGDVELFTLPDGSKAWSLLSTSYVKAAVETVQRLLAEDGRELKTGKRPHKGPLPYGYKPELDVTDECDAEMTSRYQQLIGILRWAVELGRIDIQTEVAVLSQYQANPRLGHLEGLYLIFHFLWKNPKKRLVMDPTEPLIDEGTFNINADWMEFYGDLVEEDPPGMPEPLGRPVIQSTFVDSDHASNVVTRRSHTGIMSFMNNALIKSFSKRQNTVESSTYGSELVALRIARDLIVEQRLKMKSIGIPINGPANVFCDNQGVVKNTSIPESTLSKKHNSINYHVVREAAAAGILRVGKEDTETNLADPLTKLMPYTKKQGLLGQILYDY